MTGKIKARTIIVVVLILIALAPLTQILFKSFAAPSTNSLLWTGNFTGFGTNGWSKGWANWTLQKSGTMSADQLDLSEETNPAGLPGSAGSALKVSYAAHAAAGSCGCGNSGGQFYSILPSNVTTLSKSAPLYLLYYVKFDTTNGKPFDFGKAGKMPGFYGGTPGSESGGNKSANAFSTRLMWRVSCSGGPGSPIGPNGQAGGELYLYPGTASSGAMCGTSTGSTYGEDMGWGSWKWQGDSKWHAIEQELDVQTGAATFWYDGKQVASLAQLNIPKIPITGIFFSTFYGGHTADWGPQTAQTAEFADFQVDKSYIMPTMGGNAGQCLTGSPTVIADETEVTGTPTATADETATCFSANPTSVGNATEVADPTSSDDTDHKHKHKGKH